MPLEISQVFYTKMPHFDKDKFVNEKVMVKIGKNGKKLKVKETKSFTQNLHKM